MKNRRAFLKLFTAGAVVGGLGLLPKSLKAKNNAMKNVLVHHVYFWLKNPTLDKDRRAFEEGIRKLVQVKDIKMHHFGVPAGTENRDVVDHSYTYSLMVMFDTKADQDAYQKDPIHLEFVEQCSHLWEKVIVYDSTDIE